MTIGPGVYDDEATQARESTHAQAVALIVVRGDRGSGFSCQAQEDVILDLPAVLRSLADQIEADAFKEVVTDFFKGWLQPDD